MSGHVLQIRVSEELWSALEAGAERDGSGRSVYARDLLEGALGLNGGRVADLSTQPDPGVTDGVAPRALRATCQHPVNRRIGRTCMLCGIVLGGAKL